MSVKASAPATIIAGIKWFGLAPDGSDLRDLEAEIERLRTVERDLIGQCATLRAALQTIADLEGDTMAGRRALAALSHQQSQTVAEKP